MKKTKIRRILIVGLVALGIIFSPLTQARAQEENNSQAQVNQPPQTVQEQVQQPPAVDPQLQQDLKEAIGGLLKGAALPPEVLEDTQVTLEDLGVKQAKILPDSPWYGLKKFGRKFGEALTFDPVKKAERQHENAIKQLAEAKQLIEEKGGVENVDPEIIIESVDEFSQQLKKIKEKTEELKEKKQDKKGEKVEELIEKLGDTQIKVQKIVDEVSEEIMENKEAMENAEEIFNELNQGAEKALGNFAEVLTEVEEEEKIPERLEQIFNKNEGSVFESIKEDEFLQKLRDKVADSKKEFIEQAQEKVKHKFEQKIQSLPPAVRVEKLKDYTKHVRGDETRHLAFLEELQNSGDVPKDVLEAIETVKGFAVKKFEDKFEKFERDDIKDNFLKHLSDGDDLDDVVVLEELKQKISIKQEEIKKRIDEDHKKGLEAFKKNFTDPESKSQAERFAQLTQEMAANPNPTTLKLIKELEAEVKQDPQKRELIEEMENKARAEFERKFRTDDMFLDRITSTSPEDMQIMHEFGQEGFLDPRMMDKFFEHQTDKFKDRLRDIDNPEEFDNFHRHFMQMPPEMVGIINEHSAGFGNMMQFKMRKMEEAAMELQGIETRMKMEQAWDKAVRDFEERLSQAETDEEKKVLFEKKRQKDLELVETEFEDRRRMMEERMKYDPFCDELCQQAQQQFFEQELAAKKNLIMAEATIREFELQMRPGNGDNPFAGKCDTPEGCKNYCNQNPDIPECQMHQVEPIYGPMHGFGSEGMGMMSQPSEPFKPSMMPPMWGQTTPPACPKGQINVPDGPNNWKCVQDPYAKSPAEIKKCPPFRTWNEAQGYCELDEALARETQRQAARAREQGLLEQQQQPQPEPGQPPLPPEQTMPLPGPFPMPECGPGEYWDNMRGCIKDGGIKECPKGEYFDFFENRCKKDDWQACPVDEYFDPKQGGCVKDTIMPKSECPQGQVWDDYKKHCVELQAKPIPPDCPIATIYLEPCPTGQTREQLFDERGCPMPPGECVPIRDCALNDCAPQPGPGACPDIWEPVCGNNGVTYSNECYSKHADVMVAYRGECKPKEYPLPFDPDSIQKEPAQQQPVPDPDMMMDGFEPIKAPDEQYMWPEPPQDWAPEPEPYLPPEDMKQQNETYVMPPMDDMMRPPTEEMKNFMPSEMPSGEFFEEPKDMGTPPPSPTKEGQVFGVMSVKKVNQIFKDKPVTLFGEMWNIIDALFGQEEPSTKPMITAYIPRRTVKKHLELRVRILCAEGNNYYRLAPGGQVLGASTYKDIESDESAPLTIFEVMYEIINTPFK